MSAGVVHYELYLKGKPTSPWTLDHVGEERGAMLAAAETMLAEHRCAAVRVVKEVWDPGSGRFTSVTLLEKGHLVSERRTATAREPAGLLCTGPADLYTAHARERIGRLMEPVLRRHRVTPWELLHRPDLAEMLEASGGEVQGAVQRVAIPEAQARGCTTHDMVRAFQKLADQTLERLIRDGRRRLFPEIDPANFATTCGRLCEEGEAAYLLGGGVAAYLAQAPSWRAKAERLCELLEASPEVGRPRALACRVLEPPLTELLGGGAPLADVVGAELDLGGQLAVLVRIAARREVELLARADAELVRALPPLGGATERLAELLEGPAFDAVRAAIGVRILAELNGPRRLRPADPEGEIVILRSLAAVLTSAIGRLLNRDDVQAAFVTRSKKLVAADFVGLYLEGRGGAVADARALIRLCENLAGPINKRTGARWLMATLESLRFEKEVRHGPDTPGVRLAALAALQRSIRSAGLSDGDAEAAEARLGVAGGWVEEEAKLVAGLARSAAPALTRLGALMRLASGEVAPLGPAADRARVEAMKLVRRPETQAELAGRPEAAEMLKRLVGPAAAGPSPGLAA